jgi:hypothetical protein
MSYTLLLVLLIAVTIGLVFVASLLYRKSKAFARKLKKSSLFEGKKKKVHKSDSKTLSLVPDAPFKYLSGINEGAEKLEKVLTDKVLEFNHFPFSTSYEEIRRSKGKSAYIEKRTIDGHEIRSLLNKHKLEEGTRVTIYFFLDGALFAGQMVYWFANAGASDTFIEVLKSKYEISRQDDDFYIEDTLGSRLVYSVKGNEAKITYYSDLKKVPQTLIRIDKAGRPSPLDEKMKRNDEALKKNLYKNL